MKGFVPGFELKTYPTLTETLNCLTNHPGQWQPFAGGTDLMVLFESGKLKQTQFLNILNHNELKGIKVDGQQIRIGALATYAEIQANAEIQEHFPLLVRSGWVTGAKAIQNRGTIGGNIANASPAADTPPSLLAYGAKIELVSARGNRVVDYAQFHLDYKKSELQKDELISAIMIPKKQWTHHYYRKVGTRAFQSISKIAVSAAALVQNEVIQEIQIGLASVGPMPMRALDLEKSLRGQKITHLRLDQVIQNFENSIRPIDDIRSTARYRKSVAGRVAEQMIHCFSHVPGKYFY